jgi:hypothetical protein
LAHLLDSTFNAINLRGKQFPLLRWLLPERGSGGKLVSPLKSNELRVLIEQWGWEYNQVSPNSARKHFFPAPDTNLTMLTI